VRLLVLASCLVACGDTTVPYAWDRPERVDAPVVAVYTATVSLRDGDVVWRPRAHPLVVRPDARRIAVIHVEPASAARRALDDELVAFLVDKIAVEAARKDVVEVQLDYEAAVSERDFARRLVTALRRAIHVRLSMTALASWCLFDDWIADLPVDEAVPMVYRMGRDREPVRRWLDEGRDFREPLCRQSVAVSLADPPPRLPSGRRRFVFNPHSWNDALPRTRSR
jgi:hypothetical protein